MRGKLGSEFEMPSLVGLRTPPGEQKVRCFFVCFCPSRFWKDRVYERNITMKELELRNKFGTLR